MSINKTIIVKPGANSDSYVTGATLNNTTLQLTLNNDKPKVNVNLGSLVSEDSYLTSGTLKNGNILELVVNNSKPKVNIDLNDIVTEDTYVTGGTLDNTILKLSRNNNQSDIDINLAPLSGSNTYISGITLNNDILSFEYTDGLPTIDVSLSGYNQDLESVLLNGSKADIGEEDFVLNTVRSGLSQEVLFNGNGYVGHASLDNEGNIAYSVTNENGSYFGIRTSGSTTVITIAPGPSSRTAINYSTYRVYNTQNVVSNDTNYFVCSSNQGLSQNLDSYRIPSLYFKPNYKLSLGVGYKTSGSGNLKRVWFGINIDNGLTNEYSTSTAINHNYQNGVDLTDSELLWVRQLDGTIKFYVDGVLWLESTTSIDVGVTDNRYRTYVCVLQQQNQLNEVSAPLYISDSIDLQGSVGSGFINTATDAGDVYFGFGETNLNGDDADFSGLLGMSKAPVKWVVDYVSSGSTNQDLQETLDNGSTADTNYDTLIKYSGDNVILIGYKNGDNGVEVFQHLDISSENTYGDIYPPRISGSTAGISSMVSGFLNDVGGYGALAFGGNSTISGNYGVVFGEGNTSANFASLSRGSSNNAYGEYSTAIGFDVNIGTTSTVFGANLRNYSAETEDWDPYGPNTRAWEAASSIGIGGVIEVNGVSAFALGNGYFQGSTRRYLKALQSGSVNISSVNGSYPSDGVGSNAIRAHIYGGLNHQIENGATDSVILGGRNVKISGDSSNTIAIGLNNTVVTGKQDSVVVGDLNIHNELLSGDSSDKILVRNANGQIRGVNLKNINTNGYDFVVGPIETGANFQSIQDAVTSAETLDIDIAIFILPGQYNEDITITKDGISIHGFSSWSTTVTQLNGDITYDMTATSYNSISELFINGSLTMTGSGTHQLWVEDISIESSDKETLILGAQGSISTLIAHKMRITCSNDSYPAVKITTPMNIDGDNCEFRRNGENGSNNIVADFGGNGNVIFRNTRFNGQVKVNRFFTLTGSDSQITTIGNSSCIDATSISPSGSIFLVGPQLTSLGGGNVISPTNFANNRLFYSRLTIFGANWSTNFGFNLGIDGIPLDNSGSGDNFLSDDGSYNQIDASIVNTTSGTTQSDIDELYDRSEFGFPLEYSYDATGATPSNRRYTFNDSNLSAATEINLAYRTRRGVDIENYLKFLLNNSVGDRFYVQRKNNADNYFIYEITGATTFSTYATIPISFIEGSGNFNNENNCIMIKN